MLDYAIRGATIVDGTGAPPFRGDVGVAGGRITELGKVAGQARERIDADGLVLTPGFVDPHTHYDAQLFWDPYASPSNVHGVTTVIGGNCGFTLAPLADGDTEYLQQLMARVEGMALPALQQGLDWEWRSFADYLDRLDPAKQGSGLAVNAGFLVGHCALRRYVMRARSVGRKATTRQLERMKQELHDALAAGGLGFSSGQALHEDGDGQPVPSRWATRDELLQLCSVVAAHPGTTLEFITKGCLSTFDDAEIDLMVNMSLAGQRPLNWNVLTVDSRHPDRHRRQLEASTAARRAGARIVPLTMPTLVPMNMNLLTFCGLWLLPGWGEILDRPVPERMALLRDPAVRARMEEGAMSPEAGVFARLADWDTYVIGDTFSKRNAGLRGRVVGDVARHRRKRAFDVLVDVALADRLRTLFWPHPPDDDEASWRMRGELWKSGAVVIGGSDAGAHLDRMMGSNYPTAFLADCIRGRRLVPLERAVHLLTDAPARLFGLRRRGRIRTGYAADLVLFDPNTVGAQAPYLRADLPGGAARLYSASKGIAAVLVNGAVTISDGAPTGDLPGRLLRSEQDTATVKVPAARRRR
jgi:N-acyl-D-aspartate/D-glutamate deacylase